MHEGKLPPNLLEKLVLSKIGVERGDVVVGPKVGEDAAVVRAPDGGYIVAHVDPITAAGELAGWLAVHVAANDVAVTGAEPRWIQLLILAPPGQESWVERVVEQASEAARELGAAIVGGHTELTSVVNRGLVAAFAYGYAKRYYPTGGAKPGDYIIMTKTAGVEGTAILATDYRRLLIERGVEKQIIERAASMYRKVSVVREALLLAEQGLVNSMHDPTEGGVLGGLYEISRASGYAIEVDLEKIPVADETRAVCKAIGVNPYRLISSGTLLATIPPHLLARARMVLDAAGVHHSVVGRVLEERKARLYVYRSEKLEEVIDEMPVDEIYLLAEKIKGTTLGKNEK